MNPRTRRLRRLKRKRRAGHDLIVRYLRDGARAAIRRFNAEFVREMATLAGDVE